MKGNLQMSYQIYEDNNRSLLKLQVENYLVIERIGKGAYAQVYKVYDTKENKLFALKVLDKEVLKKNTTNLNVRKKNLRNIENESQYLNAINHENVLPLYKVLESNELKLLVTKYCKHGTLRQ